MEEIGETIHYVQNFLFGNELKDLLCFLCIIYMMKQIKPSFSILTPTSASKWKRESLAMVEPIIKKLLNKSLNATFWGGADSTFYTVGQAYSTTLLTWRPFWKEESASEQEKLGMEVRIQRTSYIVHYHHHHVFSRLTFLTVR